MLSPQQQQTLTWPIAGDVPDLQAIIADQAATVAANAALIDAYQNVLNAAQNVPGLVATGTGTGTGNQLAVTAAAGGPIVAGAVVADAGNVTVPLGTTILGQISGSSAGGNGTYLTSKNTSAAATALTFTPPADTNDWPALNDAPTLMLIVQDQLTVLRQQTALLQGYQTLLNDSETSAPPTGP